MAPEPRPAPPRLRRTLGMARVAFTGVGVILGAGVYALIGPAAARAGGAMWVAFAVAGLTAGLTAYSYARFARLRPKASPEFQYSTLAFGPVAGFVAGWLMLLADLLAAATVALGFGGYLAHLAGTPVVPNALALLLAMTVLVAAGVDSAVGFAMALTIVEAAGLLFVAVVGLPAWPGADFLEAPGGLGGIWGAATLIFFAYLGFDELGNFAEEMRRPERDLPRALLVAMAASTLIYMLVALSAVAVVGAPGLAASGAPLALVARAVLGPGADAMFSVVALCATANTVLLLLASAARSMYGMAEAGVLPRALARIHGRTAVPLVATVTVVVLAGAFVLLGDLAYVASLTDAAVLASFGMVNLALAWLAIGGRIPRRLSDVLVPILATVMCGSLIVHAGWPGLAMTAAFALVGLGFVLSLGGAARPRSRADGPRR